MTLDTKAERTQGMTEPFTIPNVNLSGGPEIAWTFAGATARAELAGAKAYAEQRGDGVADLRVTDASGQILADVVVYKLPADETITVSLMNVGCALLWSHARSLHKDNPTNLYIPEGAA